MAHGGKEFVFEFAGALGYIFCFCQRFFHPPPLADLVRYNNAVHRKHDKDYYDHQNEDGAEIFRGDIHLNFMRDEVVVGTNPKSCRPQRHANSDANFSANRKFHKWCQTSPTERRNTAARIGGSSGRGKNQKFQAPY